MGNLEQAISEWREAWIAKLIPRSQHPALFWAAVADRLIADRRKLGHDPLCPIEHSILESSDAFKMLFERNQEAINLEMTGRIEEALILYEAGVADCFSSVSPYDRLRSIYTTRSWYQDALRVCLDYVAQPERPGLESHEYFRAHVAQLVNRL
ncbi:hypothetical protein ANAEL_03214 [Anaerolineales bacterium]|nr:hypothetical protein ANAEL_03214 [Anaerolineales bacterium]